MAGGTADTDQSKRVLVGQVTVRTPLLHDWPGVICKGQQSTSKALQQALALCNLDNFHYEWEQKWTPRAENGDGSATSGSEVPPQGNLVAPPRRHLWEFWA